MSSKSLLPGPGLDRPAIGGGSGENLFVAAAKGQVVAALRTCFNFLALNLALVVACVPVVTFPLALDAATVALERWRVDREDRVVREFISALRSRPPFHTTLQVGVPLVVAGLASEEVHFFAKGGSPASWLCLGSGVAALLMALTSLGYVLLLTARQPAMPAPELWSLAARLAVRNFVLTGPLFVAEIAGAVLLGFVDPALLLIGLPLGFLQLARLTARLGLRRVQVEH